MNQVGSPAAALDAMSMAVLPTDNGKTFDRRWSRRLLEGRRQ